MLPGHSLQRTEHTHLTTPENTHSTHREHTQSTHTHTNTPCNAQQTHTEPPESICTAYTEKTQRTRTPHQGHEYTGTDTYKNLSTLHTHTHTHANTHTHTHAYTPRHAHTRTDMVASEWQGNDGVVVDAECLERGQAAQQRRRQRRQSVVAHVQQRQRECVVERRVRQYGDGVVADVDGRNMRSPERPCTTRTVFRNTDPSCIALFMFHIYALKNFNDTKSQSPYCKVPCSYVRIMLPIATCSSSRRASHNIKGVATLSSSEFPVKHSALSTCSG